MVRGEKILARFGRVVVLGIVVYPKGVVGQMNAMLILAVRDSSSSFTYSTACFSTLRRIIALRVVLTGGMLGSEKKKRFLPPAYELLLLLFLDKLAII